MHCRTITVDKASHLLFTQMSAWLNLDGGTLACIDNLVSQNKFTVQ